jgi:hypothetical protein
MNVGIFWSLHCVIFRINCDTLAFWSQLERIESQRITALLKRKEKIFSPEPNQTDTYSNILH